MIRIEDMTAGYDGRAAVRDVTLTLPRASLTCLVGLNGSGKSTLLRVLNSTLAPSNGHAVVEGIDADGTPASRRALAPRVGLVRQDPSVQLVASRVDEEVAFGPRNLGLMPREVRSRVKRALTAVGLRGRESEGVDGLSGGERQRLALAGVLAMEPAWLLLDEANAQLDEASRARVRAIVGEEVAAGTGVVWATHHAREVAMADLVVLLVEGSVAWQGSVAEFFSDAGLVHAAGMDDDPVSSMAAVIADKGARLKALAQDETALRELERVQWPGRPVVGVAPEVTKPHEGGVLVDDVFVKMGVRASLGCEFLRAPSGAVTLVAGASGSGKTTLARLMAGVLAPDKGAVTLDGESVRPGMVGLAFQRAADQLFCESVAADVSFGPEMLGYDREQVRRRTEAALDAVGLDEGLWGRSPHGLSGGEARRAAIAGVLACGPRAYVFDEPTAGLDGLGRTWVRSTLRTLAEGGAAVTVTSHDLDAWLPYVDAIALVADGAVLWQGHPEEAARPDVLAEAGLRPSLALLAASVAAAEKGGRL